MSSYIIQLTALCLAFTVRVYCMENIQSMSSLNLVGHYTDELPKSSDIGRFTQPLTGNPGMALEYRIEAKQEYILLLERDKENRWKIVDALKVPKHSDSESISFACSPAGGPAPGAGAGAFGVVKQIKKSHRVAASRGWMANLESKRLVPIQDKETICDLHGVD
jgi:hypothetical protein